MPEQADVVVVGAGVAGLYVAWRLLRDDPRRRVVVLDRLGRIGGRLDTDLVQIRGLAHPGPDGTRIEGDLVQVKEEEGGMRFNAAMPELLALLDALGLWDRIVPFGMGDDENLFHIRGRSFTAGRSKRDDHAIWSELYNLAPNERDKSPGEIVLAVYRDLVLGNGEMPPDAPSPAFWQRFRTEFTFQGRPLNQWGLWSLLRAFGLSEECITMLADTTGFQAPFYGGSNVGAALQLLEDFPLDPKFFALDDGFGTLPAELHTQVTQAGGRVRLETPVQSLTPGAEGHVVRTPAGSIQAAHVVLTLSPHALLQLLDASPELAAPALRHACTQVRPMRMCKVNLYYTHAWWRDHSEARRPQVRNGGSFTTLPLGAVYVFDPLQGHSADGPAGLTIYADHTKAQFWQQLQETGEMFGSALQAHHDAARPQVLFPASRALVAEATRQLRELFAMIAVPPPVLTSYRLWSGENEFGYAYHQWARGADDRAVLAQVASPAPHLSVCNEAFSDDQGWVNGALRSADRALAGFALPALPPTARVLPGERPSERPGTVRD